MRASGTLDVVLQGINKMVDSIGSLYCYTFTNCCHALVSAAGFLNIYTANSAKFQVSTAINDRPNRKLIYISIINGPYVRRMIPEPGDQNHEVPVNETFHELADDELTEKELKQVEADNQAIQTILLGLPEDIYAAVDSCETAQEI
ncbi:hypothetical protein Tco_1344283 [Tanacetum coccineum]